MKFYSPLRVYRVFIFLLTIYLVIKKRDSFLLLKPLKPKKLKSVIIKLGASFIKLSQVLATRSDFFSQEYLDELKNLHDQLPPMREEDFNYVFSISFKDKDIFESFTKEPIASASIGQVHMAFLKNGKKVAVKLRRRGIKTQVLADIKIINSFNTLFKPLFSIYTKNSIESVIEEFSKMIVDEVSLTKELQNLKKFRKLYKKEGVRFPKGYKQHSCDSALVMSFEEGFRFDDKESILNSNIDFKSIISKLVHFYTTQMLINGYFHADPHPGNLLVNKDGELVLLDFGMVKTVPNDKRVAIIELVKSANEKDYDTYISASKRLGTVAYEAPMDDMVDFTSKMFDIFSNNNLSSQSMQQLAFEVLDTTKNLPFKLPSDAVYILRVSTIVEGLGTTYIENFNGIKDILPILNKSIPKALGAKESISKTLIDEFKDTPFIAKDIKKIIKSMSEGSLEVTVLKPQLDYLEHTYKKEIKSYAISFAFFFSSIIYLLYGFEPKEGAIALFLIGFIKILYK